MLACPAIVLLLAPLAGSHPRQDAAPTVPPLNAAAPPAPAERMDWWREARFGLFLHWGLYALPAGEWNGATDHGEWIRHSAQIPLEQYEKLADLFAAPEFDAGAWAELAQEAGMQYVVITTKHHDGFCLFDSELTGFDVAATPFRRDVMAELAEACRARGLQIGWYYSIMDWRHPDYLPRRPWETRGASGADFARYRDYLHGQVTELLTRYGEIGVLWFDGQWESTWTEEQGKALYELCRKLQPDLIVNNRVGKGALHPAQWARQPGHSGDFATPEQEIPAAAVAGVDWETCLTMNRHWGWNKHDQQWKSAQELIRTLVDVASKGGNLLLNVGPTAEGRFPDPAVERLREIGRWMKVNGSAIRGTKASPLAETPPWGRCTLGRHGAGARLYLHVFEWPADGRLPVAGIGNEVLSAGLLGRGEAPLAVARNGTEITVQLPPAPPDPACSVVVLDLLGETIALPKVAIRAAAGQFVSFLDVELDGGGKEVEVHYTLDGSEPSLESPRYQAPLRLEDSTVVKARSYFRGRPVHETTERRFSRAVPLPAERTGELHPGLKCEIYAGDWDALPDFAALQPIAMFYASAIGLQAGPAGEFHGRRYSGYWKVPAADLYLFVLSSDDGSRLWIDGELVIDNDGLHVPEERQGEVALAAGPHRIQVEYFNKTGGEALDLRVAALGAPFRPLPADALWHLP